MKFMSIVPVVVMVPALALSAQAAPLTTSKSTTAEEQADASSYWTRARIAGAPPLKMPVDIGPARRDTAVLDDAALAGPAGSAPPGKGEPGADHIARAAYAEDWAALEGVPALDEADAVADIPAGTAGVYTSYDVNKKKPPWKIYPHKWDGKFTFRVPGGTGSCSATSISGNNIVTAAHCVFDTTTDTFYSHWVFTPAYRKGSAPYGTFAATKCWILTAFADLTGTFEINTWTRHDVAVCKVGKNSAGQTLNGTVGFAGRLWDADYTQLNFNSGYPALDYNLIPIAHAGQYLRACTNESFEQTTDTLGGGCNWGPGMSGGSWLVGYQPYINTGWVNSVNSGLFQGQPNIYGARFSSNNIVVLCDPAAAAC